ncbi:MULTISPECIES: phage tail tape measure protein [unclassified Paenibacillus]|uniref:phage tail tape measure protein n=1 Tax=unclassified Paenibacillus TaxID=185978 RepID=UPI00020D7004|nr:MULTISPECIES: phage tail tape measure protein [unclassified Paenibacillus]EGL20078.1 phage tail tape measure protein, TP901 family [Paenibacillus sp. HGF7]EPD82027.1 phage tail tape measure protein, TP901 family, core region [Paenibacillus sp. HGH0039]
MADDLRILITAGLNVGKTTTEINKAVAALDKKIDKLQLRIDVDQNFTKNIQSFTGAIEKLKKQLEELNKTFQNTNAVNNYKKSLSDTDNQLKTLGNTAQASRAHVAGIGEAMASAIAGTLTWGVATTAIYGSKRAMEEMLQVIIEVDTQMTHLKRVMNADTNFEEMLNGSISMANELGQKITKINEALIDAAQAGYAAQEALDITRTATLASNVSDLSPKEAMSNLIAAMKAYKIEAKDTIQIVDKLNQVDNDYSITTKTLSQSMEKAGATAATYGVSLDELIGYTAAIGEVTRESGNIIGNAQKSIFSSLYSKKAATALAEVGVAITDVNGQNRKASEIINELGSKWKSLSMTQQQHTALSIAGKYQLTRFLALMGNFDIAIKATQTSLTSQGSAFRENEKYMDSLQAKLNLNSAAWQNLAITIGNSGVTSAFSAIVTGITGMVKGFTSLTEATYGINIYLPVAIAGVYGLVKAFNALKAAGIGLKASFGWIGAAVVLAELLVSAFVGSTKSVEVNSQALAENANQTRMNADNLQSLVDQYNKLEPLAAGNSEKQKELESVLNQINSIAPQLIEHTGKYGDSLSLNKEKANEYIESLRQMTKEQVEQAKLANGIELNNVNTEIAKAEEKLKKLGTNVSKEFSDLKVYQKLFNAQTANEARENFSNMTRQMKSEIKSLYDSGDISKALLKEEELNKLKTKFDAFLIMLENSGERLKGYSDAVNDKNGLEQKKTQLLERERAIDKLTQTQDKARGSTDQLSGAFNEQTGEIENNTDALQDNNEQVATGIAKNQNFIKQFNTTTNELKTLNNAISDVTKGQALSSEATQDLILQYPELASYVQISAEGFTIEKSALDKVRQAKIDKAKADLENEKASTAAAISNTIARMQAYGKEIGAIRSVAEAKGKLEDVNRKIIENSKPGIEEELGFKVATIPNQYREKFEQQKRAQLAEANATRDALRGFISEMTGFDAQIAVLQKTLDNPNLGVSSSKTKTPKEKSAKTKSEPSAYDESEKYKINEYERALRSLDDELRESEAIINRYPDTSKDYRDELTKQVDIRKKMQALAHNEAERLRSEISDVKNKIAVGKLNQKQENDLLKQLEQKENNLSRLSNNWWDYQVAVESTQKKITESIAKYNKEQFDISKNWIDQEKYYKRLSLDDELAAWERVQARYDQGTEERLNADKEVYRVRQELLSKYEEDFNKVMEKASQAADETIEKLRKKMETKESFNPGELADSVDAIMASIDMIDKKYPNGYSPIDTSDEARTRLNAYKGNITGLAANMKSMMEMPYQNADQLKNMIDGQIMFAGNIKKLMNETNALIKQTETAYRMQEASLENQIKLHQQRNDKIIEGLNKALEVKDTFNSTDFSTSINSILSALDALDGKYVKGNFVESTLGTREDLESYKKKVTEIAEAIKNYQNSANFSSSSITEQTNYINGLKAQIDSLNDSIRVKELQYKNEEEALAQLIKAKEKSYDDEINKQKEALKNLDEQIDKEDRLKKLKDINDELDKVKNDKRFSYINADGKEILTYDKGKVAELEKQRDDLLKQYEREDVKKALQDSIDELEKTKNETIQKLQEQLDKTKVIHQNELESQKLYVKSLEDLYRIGLQDVQNKIGQLKSQYDTEIANEQARLDTLRQVHQSELDSMNMYAGYLSQLNQFLTQDTQTKIDTLKTIYDKEAEDLKTHLKEMVETTEAGKVAFHEVLDEYTGGAISKLETMVSSARDRLKEMQAIMAAMASMSGGAAPSSANVPKYHTGGVVGSAPLASNEVPAILKLGEEVFTQDHIAKLKSVIMQPINFVGSILGTVRNTIPDTPIRNNQAMAGPTYNLSNFTIQANNPTELFSGLNNLIKSNRT